MEPTYRVLTPRDEPLLWTALYDALHVPPGDPPLPRDIVQRPEIARYVEGWMTRPGDRGLGVAIDGTSIGAAWLRCWTGAEVGYGYIDDTTPELSMSLDRAYRGMGIGTELLQRILADARRDHAAVSLSVSPSNPACRLYERVGFVPVGSSGTSTTMRKRF